MATATLPPGSLQRMVRRQNLHNSNLSESASQKMLMLEDANNLLQHLFGRWLLWIAERPLVCGLTQNGKRLVNTTLKARTRITRHRH